MRLPLKRLDELLEPDKRSLNFVRGSGSRIEIDDRYASICRVRLTDEVPEQIWDEFETVRNLYLYSWYVYDFTVPAVMYAQAIVEKALKEKCKLEKVDVESAKGLRKLLRLAIDKGWLRNAHFPFAMEWQREEIIVLPSGVPTFRREPRYTPGGVDYCEIIAGTLPKLRNMDMHGEAGLSFPSESLRSIEICACIINALFPDLDNIHRAQDAASGH